MALSGKAGVDRSNPTVIPRRMHEIIRASYARSKAYATIERGEGWYYGKGAIEVYNRPSRPEWRATIGS